MRMRIGITLLVCLGACATTSAAAGLGKAAIRGSEKTLGRVLRRPAYRAKAFDFKRDRTAPLSVLKRGRTVDRYTRSSRAATEIKRGIPANRHMTSLATRKPLTATNAKLRLGLPTKPNVVERITLPKGTQLHFNKVVGGKPGYGEITVPSRLPKSSISKVLRLHR
jgi:hypothetical protein